jgi:hypothetical protein
MVQSLFYKYLMGSNTTKELDDLLLPGYFAGLIVNQLASQSIS